MTEQALPLTTFYTGWAVYQQNLVTMIAPLSPEQPFLPLLPPQAASQRERKAT
jgi:hypothetical protein